MLRELVPGATALRELRLELGMTLAGVAAALGVSHVAVRSWETGQVRPNAQTRPRIREWSRGRIEESAWLTDRERGLAPVAPIKRARAKRVRAHD